MKLLTYLQQTKGQSRRTITEAIKKGVISVNNQPISSFVHEVQEGDSISRRDQTMLVKKQSLVSQVILFHKPIGYVVSRSDPHNPTIFELLPSGREKIYYPIGRLDKNSSGLLLLTNNPQLVHELLHPSKKMKKIYQVTVTPKRSTSDASKAKTGVWVDFSGKMVSPKTPDTDFLRVFSLEDKVGYLEIVLEEGKKRHIRRLLKALGYETTFLHRTGFGQRSLDDIPSGGYITVD